MLYIEKLLYYACKPVQTSLNSCCAWGIFSVHIFTYMIRVQHANDIPTRGVHQVGYKRFPPTRQNIQPNPTVKKNSDSYKT